MKLNLQIKIAVTFIFVIGLNLFGQSPKVMVNLNENTHEKCGFTTRHNQLLANDPNYALKRQQEEAHIADFERNPMVDKVVMTIPVVVHVFHTGQAVGTGINISDAQIQSAIDNLNAAYSNTSTASTTYTGVDTQIQFCLAQRDPNGNPTTGIVRVNANGLAGYSAGGVGTGGAVETSLKALSRWDNTKYYNFWIVSEIDNNGGGSGTQGYAYFPGAGPTVDGAVMLYNAFGYDPTGALGYNLKSYTNRNATPVHEVGHALNLYHTFEGDGSGSTCPGAGNLCGSNVGDCVSDTPPHKRSNSDCLINTVDNTCNNVDRDLYVHNFMDYSGDVCQTQFTNGQATRMTATLTGGGLRASLTLSDGCNPANNNFDVSITSIVAPISSYCQTTFSPQVNLRNFGLQTLTSATITYNIDGGANQIFNWTGSLASGSTELVTLNSMTTTVGAHTFTAISTNPNGNADEYAANNSSSVSFTISSSSTLPFIEDFEGAFPPASWTRTSGDPADATAWNVDGIKQFEKRAVTVESDGTAGNALAINGFAYSTSTGDRTDQMVSPSINLGSASAPELKFQVSHAYYNTTSNTEGLKVYISTDCGVNYAVIYDKSAATLATAGQNSNSWAPTAVGHWRQETIDLTPYAGDVITLKFETVSNYGNNVFIDKINLLDNCTTPVVSSNPTSQSACSTSNATFSVTNTGGGTYQWQESTNGGGTFSNISNGGVYSNALTSSLTLTGVTVGMNANQYRCVITNGCGSVNSSNATLTVNATPSTPTISAGGATTFCSGGNVVLTSSSASGNTWSTGATTQSITVSASGNYTVTATTGACVSAASTATTVTVNPTPSIALGTTSNPTACLATDGSIQVTGSGTGNISWTGTTTGAMNGVTLPTTITGLGAGSYNITFNNGCLSNSITGNLTDPGAPATPTISAGGSTTFCAGGSVILTSSSATGNNWSTGAVTQSITVSASGSYTVFVTNAGCTSGTSSATTVTVNSIPATPTISAGGATTFCSGGNVVLTSSSASGNTWSTGETTQSITVSASGNYTVTTTTGACVSAASTATTVTVNPTPVITLGTTSNPTACLATDGSVQITGSGTGNISWTGTTTGTMNGVTLPTSITGLGAGSYNITFDNGCLSNSITGNLTDPGVTTPTVTASGPLTICIGESVTLTSSSATGNTWSTNETTQSIVVSSTGTYTVTVLNAGCSATSANVDVVVNSSAPSAPTVSASGSLTFCEGGNVVLTSSSSAGNTWSTGDLTPSITVSTSGDYTVSIGTGNCVATSSIVTVTMNLNPTVTLSPFADICNNASSFALTQGSPAGGNYAVNGISSNNFDPATANLGTNTILYSFTDVNSCSASATETISVNDCSGIEEPTLNLFSIFPNPSNSKITIQGELMEKVSSIELRDELGRLVKLINEKELKSEIDLSNLSVGIYTLILNGDSFKEIQKIQVIK
ncbi:MAG: M43 family zinc metalloprotease [Flavobacteriia bacterium]